MFFYFLFQKSFFYLISVLEVFLWLMSMIFNYYQYQYQIKINFDHFDFLNKLGYTLLFVHFNNWR